MENSGENKPVTREVTESEGISQELWERLTAECTDGVVVGVECDD
jgi:hypothetical protein